ncbi:ATP-grasp domain-containing protein [Kordiimonas aquimaris]|uniref:ATP-grasp domain-containing protein n=1 Tax=Kordiimonas aquimaris TaxID=707591 RepID=UPI0021D3316F|nr:ATP-grasp domain-containing protein [Kordiimonas aquimaris]
MKPRLLLLGGGIEQLNALRIAKELGADVVVFDGHDTAACELEATEFHTVNIKDHEALLAKAESSKVSAVFVHAAELAIECALVAEHLKLPGIPVHVAELGTDKSLRSACFQKAGIHIPSFRSIPANSSYEVWQKMASEIGFPLVAKPTKLAGAQGVEYIAGELELSDYFTRSACFDKQSFVVEEYIAGEQLSTESVSIDSKVISTSTAKRHYDTTKGLWPYQIEDGHSMPWQDAQGMRPEIEKTIEACRKAFGLKTGVLKGDVVIKPNGDIVVLEMAVRTSGGRFCDTVVPLCSGINILYPLMQYALGQSPDISFLKPKHNTGVSQRFVILPEGTRLRQHKILQHLLLDKDIISSWFRDDLHDLDVVPAIRSHRDRLGYVICVSKDRKLADRRALEVVDEIAAALCEVRE